MWNKLSQLFKAKKLGPIASSSELPPQKPTGPFFRWGPALLTDDDCQAHFFALSTTGGGKTLNMTLLLNDVVKLIGKSEGYRALVYDPKGDMLPLLYSITLRDLVKTFNPFLKNGVAWDVCRDIESSAVAIRFAHTLIPERDEAQPFFPTAAREIVWGIVLSFMLAKIDWRLSDLFRAIKRTEHCKAILETNPFTEYIVSTYLTDAKLSTDILATLRGLSKKLEPVAALWDYATERVAIKDLTEKEMILVLGNHETSRQSIDQINNVLWDRYTDLVLAEPEKTTKRYWSFIDELSEANIKNLKGFAKRSRSTGGRLVCSCQSLAGLYSDRLYGESEAKDLMSCLGNRFIGRLECALSANWASELIGEREEYQSSYTTSIGETSSKSTTKSLVVKKTLLPSELLSMAPSGAKTGLHGLYTFRSRKPCWSLIPADRLFNELLPKVEYIESDFEERSTDNQLLAPWTDEEFAAFCPPKLQRHQRPTREQYQFEDLFQRPEPPLP
jgi:hypothetical protein